jgi:hypothetical protein
VLERGQTPRRSLDMLVEEALAHGGRDNVTAVLLLVNDPLLPLPADGESPEVLRPDRSGGGRGLWRRLRGFFDGRHRR